jgi:UMF1 family MFS transporter
MKQERKAQIGWVLYDFANTIFSMNIVTFFFAPWLILTLGVEDIYYSLAYSISMILVALSMPSLGRRADRSSGKLASLKLFTVLCVLFTVLMSLAAVIGLSITTTAMLTLISFAVANYFYEGGLTFYNSLLADVSSSHNIGKISGIGVGVGYLGAIFGLLVVMPITEGNIIPGIEGRQYAFLPTAMLFLVFSIPIFRWVREKSIAAVTPRTPESFFAGWRTALRETRDYPGVLRFLISDYLIEDAIATLIVFMSVYAEAVAGFADADKVVLFISSTVCAFLGSLLFGLLTDRIGGKKSLVLATAGWVVVLLAAIVLEARLGFFILGGFVGIFLGAVWTSSRPLLNSLVPREKLGQFYGLYTLSGRAAATVGPLLWGLVVLLGKQDGPLGRLTISFLETLGISVSPELAGTIHYRLAVVSLLIVMSLGLIILLKVPDRRPE